MRTPNRILANRLLLPARSGSRSSLLAVTWYARSFYLQRLINSEICALIERSLLFLSVALRLGVLKLLGVAMPWVAPNAYPKIASEI
jgi:hypothetical protein